MPVRNDDGALREVHELAQGHGLVDKTLDVHAPRLAAELSACAPLYGVTSSLDALDVVLTKLRDDEELRFLGQTELWGKGKGEDWAAVLRMMLNTEQSPENLTERRIAFKIPERLAATYRVSSTNSSRFRTEIERDAASVLVMRIRDTPPARRSPAGNRGVHRSPTIRTLLRRLIAQHGLNDDQWAEAVSAQYFVCLLARKLQQTHRPDYRELLDRFLESFTYRSDDSIVLNAKKVLVTPEETKAIREQMMAEDEVDPFFRHADKTKAQVVDVDALHLNYLYGLTLGIAGPGESAILSTLRDLAATHLLGRDNERVLDLDGGWCPYRIPWLTARVLISFADLPDSYRTSLDADEIIRNAVISLTDRLTGTDTWRSGVGEWVSEWESTGLCLEALLRFEDVLEEPELIAAAASACLRRMDEWTGAPSFDTDEAANLTLGSVIAATSILASSGVAGFDLTPDETRQLAGYVTTALQVATEAVVPQTRQFCTIPQLAYYATKLL